MKRLRERTPEREAEIQKGQIKGEKRQINGVRKGERSERLKWTQKGERKEEINREKGKDKHREKDGERER